LPARGGLSGVTWIWPEYNGRVEIALAIGLGVGLASVAGVRAFLPLALAALFGVLGLFSFPSGIVAVGDWVYVGVFAGLAVLEIALDKIPAVEGVFNIVMVPVRALAGALLFGAAFGSGIEAGVVLVIGGVVAGAVAVLKVVLRPLARDASSGVSTSFLSLIEDVIGLVGGVLALFVPYLPVLLVVFLLFFFSRIRKRRGRKFGGLRILGD
jgi:hypothetical protein